MSVVCRQRALLRCRHWVTAAHNPSRYNGYKVYGAGGCQITTESATEILSEIERMDVFSDVK